MGIASKKLTVKYSYALFALPAVVQMSMWFVAQRIPARFDIWCPLDDLIPFCKYFVIPYLLWFPFYIGGLIYLFFRAKRAFITTCMHLTFGCIVAEFVFIFFQNQITFRPESTLAVTGFFSWAVSVVYSGGTTVSACPSLHCYVSGVVCVGFLKADCYRRPAAAKTAIIILTVLIWMSTVLIKQHSIVDVAASLVLCAVMYEATYSIKWPFLRKGGPLFTEEHMQ